MKAATPLATSKQQAQTPVMSSGETLANFALMPHQATKSDQNGLMLAAQGTETKSQLLTELMSHPELFGKISPAWSLVMWLIYGRNGVVVSTYEEIADHLDDISKSTVKKWADTLVERGLMERQQKGNRVELKLTGTFMKIATAADVVYAGNVASYFTTAEITSLEKLAEGVNGLGGQVVLSINGCQLGKNA